MPTPLSPRAGRGSRRLARHHADDAAIAVGKCVLQRVGDQLVYDEPERNRDADRQFIILHVAGERDRRRGAGLEVPTEVVEENPAVHSASRVGHVQPLAEPSDDMNELARLFEGARGARVVSPLGALANERIQRREAIGDAVRHLLQAHGLARVFRHQSFVLFGDGEQRPADLVGENDGAGGQDREEPRSARDRSRASGAAGRGVRKTGWRGRKIPVRPARPGCGRTATRRGTRTRGRRRRGRRSCVSPEEAG